MTNQREDSTEAIEMSQHLVRKSLEMGGCCGLQAQVEDSTCLVLFPRNPHEWCPPCLMVAAGEMLMKEPR